MSRLTRYEPNEHSMFPYQLKDNEIGTKLDSIHKLGKLEDLEDELGCPLDVVFKALKDKEIVIKHTYGLDEPIEKLKTHKISGLQFNKTDFVFWLYEDIVTDFEFDVNVKDYKKTWWLKEDLSE